MKLGAKSAVEMKGRVKFSVLVRKVRKTFSSLYLNDKQHLRVTERFSSILL